MNFKVISRSWHGHVKGLSRSFTMSDLHLLFRARSTFMLQDMLFQVLARVLYTVKMLFYVIYHESEKLRAYKWMQLQLQSITWNNYRYKWIIEIQQIVNEISTGGPLSWKRASKFIDLKWPITHWRIDANLGWCPGMMSHIKQSVLSVECMTRLSLCFTHYKFWVKSIWWWAQFDLRSKFVTLRWPWVWSLHGKSGTKIMLTLQKVKTFVLSSYAIYE